MPAFKKLTTLPETLQLPFWITVKLTGSPELAVALTLILLPTVWVGIAPKVIVCPCCEAVTVKL